MFKDEQLGLEKHTHGINCQCRSQAVHAKPSDRVYAVAASHAHSITVSVEEHFPAHEIHLRAARCSFDPLRPLAPRATDQRVDLRFR